MILPMKKATIFAMRRDREALLLELQRASIMMITENDGCVRDERLSETTAAVQDSEDALRFLNRYGAKPGFFDDQPTLDYAEFVKRKDEAAALAKQAARIEADINAAETEILTAKSTLEQYLPWLSLEIPLCELKNTQTSTVHTGYIPLANAEKLRETDDGAYVEILGPAAGSLACLIVCHKSSDEEVIEAAKALGFVEAAPPAAQTTAAEAHAELNERVKAAQQQIDTLKAEAKTVAEKIRDVEVLYDKLSADLSRQNAPYSETETTFFIEGWVTEERASELEEILQSATDLYELVLEDPAEGEQPPTATRNHKLIEPFEMLTDMFSRPSPLEKIDPNPVMAPWYWIIFGMMMGDFGYGLVMLLLFGAFLKIKKPKGDFKKLITVLMYASIPTMFWGVMFGSYFGAEWFPAVIVVPLYDPLKVMIISLVIGAIHICFGLGLSAYYNIKRGAWQDAVGLNISWIFLLLGIGLIFVPALSVVSYACLGIGAVCMLGFAKNDTKNPIKRIFGGVGKLYDITGYMSDILSYSRILALMMSSGVVGMVMNILAGMVQGGVIGWVFSIMIYIVGHAFNLVMGLLSAYVHASRLQYIEFYGKFYEGGGYAFSPLSVQTKYTNVVTDKQ